jgi:hypothetical protein
VSGHHRAGQAVVATVVHQQDVTRGVSDDPVDGLADQPGSEPEGFVLGQHRVDAAALGIVDDRVLGVVADDLVGLDLDAELGGECLHTRFERDVRRRLDGGVLGERCLVGYLLEPDGDHAPVVVTDDRIRDLVPVEPTPFDETVAAALEGR